MDNLKNNTLSINMIILLIAMLFIFTLYIIKDYNKDDKRSIDLSNQIFKKYKGHKDENIYKCENDTIIEETKNDNIMKEDFFIKKKNKDIENIYVSKLNKKNDNIIYDLRKKVKVENNPNIIKCDTKNYIVKNVEIIDIDSQILNSFNKKSEFVLESSHFEKEDNCEINNRNNNLSETNEHNIDNKLLDLEERVSKLRELSDN